MLQLLADASGQNIVVSDSVSGSVTLRLQNVPWDQALDIVLRTKAWTNAGPTTSSSSRRRTSCRPRRPSSARDAERRSSNSRRCAPNTCRSTTPRRSDLAGADQSRRAASLLSPRGSVSVDDRTNTLLLQDTADLADIRRLVDARHPGQARC